MVPVGAHQAALRQLDDLQARHDALERQHAALQHRVPAGSSSIPPAAEAGAAQPASGTGSPAAAGMSRSVSAPAAAAAAAAAVSAAAAGSRPGTGTRSYCPAAYGGGVAGGAAPPPDAVAGLQAQLLERDVALFDAQLRCDQAVADAERQRKRLHGLLDALSPHPHDSVAAAAIAEARQLAGLPAAAVASGGAEAAPAPPGGTGKPAVKLAAAGRRGGPGAGGGGGREAELLATIELLKGALERTKRGLESGVPSSKFMAAVVGGGGGGVVWRRGAPVGCGAHAGTRSGRSSAAWVHLDPPPPPAAQAPPPPCRPHHPQRLRPAYTHLPAAYAGPPTHPPTHPRNPPIHPPTHAPTHQPTHPQERAKALKARVAELEGQLAGAAAVREELARVQRELGSLHGTCAALRAQARAAREQREESAGARERQLAGQVGGKVAGVRGSPAGDGSGARFAAAWSAHPRVCLQTPPPNPCCLPYRWRSWSAPCRSATPRWKPWPPSRTRRAAAAAAAAAAGGGCWVLLARFAR